MDPNRFLGDKEAEIISIEPNVKSQNEVSPLTRKVKDVMVDADEPVEGTQFEIAGNRDAALLGKAPKKVVAVYEDDDEINEEGDTSMSKSNELEGGLVEGLGTLLEGELERAELVLATKDLVSRLQKMIEDLGKMGTDDIMPLVDGLRTHFGPQVAENFSSAAEQHIQEAANAVQSMKDALDQESQRLEGRISDEDAEQPMNDMATDAELGGDDADLAGAAAEPAAPEGEEGAEGGEEDLGDLLGGEEGAEGEETPEEPLGRAKKEGYIVTVGGKKVRISESQYAILTRAKRITNRIKQLSETAKPKTVDFTVSGVHFRLSEQQIKDLLFAKNFNRLVEAKKAKVAKLSENQAVMLKRAKKLTERIRQLVNEKQTSKKK